MAYTDGAAEVIGRVKTVGAVKMSSDEQECTTHDDTGGFKTYIQALLEAGTIDIEGNMAAGDAGQGAVLTQFNARTTRAFKVTYPDGPTGTVTGGSTWEFDASIKAFEYGEAPVLGILSFKTTLRIDGLPSFTEASAS